MDLNKLEKLKEELLELHHLSSAVAVLHWDMEVYMPQKGADLRAKTIAELSGLIHNKFISPQFGKLIKEAKREMEKGTLSEGDSRIVNEVWREYSREKKLPLDFVKELSELESKSQTVWAQAREKSDFKSYKNSLLGNYQIFLIPQVKSIYNKYFSRKLSFSHFSIFFFPNLIIRTIQIFI